MTAPKNRPNADKIIDLRDVETCPDWIQGEVRERWETKVAVLRRRGVSIAGYEDTFSVYVSMLHSIETRIRCAQPVKAADIQQLRSFAREFYDTPLATDQQRAMGKGPQAAAAPTANTGNPFAARGVSNFPTALT